MYTYHMQLVWNDSYVQIRKIVFLYSLFMQPEISLQSGNTVVRHNGWKGCDSEINTVQPVVIVRTDTLFL